jgi:hypothetical protein
MRKEAIEWDTGGVCVSEIPAGSRCRMVWRGLRER